MTDEYNAENSARLEDAHRSSIDIRDKQIDELRNANADLREERDRYIERNRVLDGKLQAIRDIAK